MSAPKKDPSFILGYWVIGPPVLLGTPIALVLGVYAHGIAQKVIALLGLVAWFTTLHLLVPDKPEPLLGDSSPVTALDGAIHPNPPETPKTALGQNEGNEQ